MGDREERAVGEAMAFVDRLVAELPGHVEVFAGFGDERLDAWKVPVPEDVRPLLRRVSGWELGQDGCPWYFGPDPTVDAGTDVWRLGPAGTFWPLHHTGAGDTVYVDVDDGRWGPVFLVTEEWDVIRLAPSFAWYVAQTAYQILLALEWASEDDTDPDDLGSALADLVVEARWETLPSYGDEDTTGPRSVTPQRADALRGAEDPDLARVADAAADDTLIADVGAAGYPARIGFGSAYEGPHPPFFRRSHGGRFVYALAGRP
jgi:hypothetical protein